jgi:HlyD family secretion protein
MKRALIGVLIVAAVGAGAGAYYVRRGTQEIQVMTAPASRGDIIDAVGATGTLQAVTTVLVGSQVSGNISWLGADFNSIVKKGQVIARVEPSVFDAQLQQARANLAQTRANLTKARSELERAKVQLTDAQQKYARAKELASRQLLPQSELDAAKVAVDTAEAMLGSQQATVVQAQAGVAQSQAAVNQNQVNLDHTVIAAPIDGIVTQRSVDVGQTVAASMQAPTLFVIAADLTKMQVNANIDEADVGRIRPGQHVTFHVDAYPTETFEGTVSQVRLQPVVVQNVTTYGTVIDVPNPELKLKPGMTANVKVEIAKRTGVLRVPNAALRFRPTAEVFAALHQALPPEVQGPGRGGRGQQSAATETTGTDSGTAATGATGAQPASPAPAAGQRGSSGDPSAGSGRQGRGSGQGNFDPARMMERFKGMSPEEQDQFIARMKERGRDTSALEAAKTPAAGANTAAPGKAKKDGTPGAQTIDALFAPLTTTESRGRVWLFMSQQLKPVNMRLGISDGTNTEVLSGELQENMEVVTGVSGAGSTTRNLPGQNTSGNPMMPGRGFGQGGRGR